MAADVDQLAGMMVGTCDDILDRGGWENLNFPLPHIGGGPPLQRRSRGG
ncbi:hypothetical protein [Amycolatopsis australiensis]|nr:hypothetical protein [Amycolatopsis australiensis]